MTRIRLLLLTFAASFLASTQAYADDFRPAYLQLSQVNGATYDVLWKVPAIDERATLKVAPEFPGGTVVLTPGRSIYADGVAVQRWRIQVAGGLEGKAVKLSGLSETRIDVLVRLERADGSSQVERALPGQPEVTFAASPGALEVVWTYLVLGVEHILIGIDHLLFVAALVMLVSGRRRLFWTITAFTVAHSITLALATLGVVNVPGPPVEAAIALSIVFVALEILRRHQGHPSLASEQPWLVGFCFGLLHGLGFAGALAEIGLPQNSIPVALLFFNLGVEIGQLLFVGALLGLAAIMARVIRVSDPRWTVVLPSYAIGGIASFWVIERLAAFA